MALAYTGGGYGGFLPNTPARDLTDEEVKQHGGEAVLLATGLYVKEGDRGDKRDRLRMEEVDNEELQPGLLVVTT